MKKKGAALLRPKLRMLQMRQYLNSIYLRNGSANKYSDENKKTMWKIQYKIKLSFQ